MLAVLGTKIESFFGGRLSPTVFPDPVILVIVQFAPTSRGLSVSVIDYGSFPPIVSLELD